MSNINMALQNTSSGCKVFTVIPRISHSSMLTLKMFLQGTSCVRGAFTGISSLLFVLYPNMSLPIDDCETYSIHANPSISSLHLLLFGGVCKGSSWYSIGSPEQDIRKKYYLNHTLAGLLFQLILRYVSRKLYYEKRGRGTEL